MNEFFLGELLLACWNLVPKGFLPCDGRTLSIQGYQALFSLIGTTYGGDGRTTFALPDLRDRVPLGSGAGHPVGDQAGLRNVTLLAGNVPPHTHGVLATGAPPVDTIPAENFFAALPGNYQTTPNTYMDSRLVSVSGSGQPHTNMMPSLALQWYIAVDGVIPFPPLQTVREGDR